MGIIKELTDAMEIIKIYCDKRNYRIEEESDNNDGCTLRVRAWDENSVVHTIAINRESRTIRIDDICKLYHEDGKFFNNGGRVLSDESQASQKDC